MGEFDYFDEVYVSKDYLDSDDDLLGTILGKSQHEDGHIEYAVSIDKLGEVYMCPPESLRRTGSKRDTKEIYPGDRIKVRVDPETGEGEIIEDL